MIRVETKHKNIFRFDNVIPNYLCNTITNFMIELKGDRKDKYDHTMPWLRGDSLKLNEISDQYVISKILEYKKLCTSIISSCTNTQLYVNHTELVLWRVGDSMPKHVDDGSVHDGPKEIREILKNRIYSSVTYLNDDYVGGETFIGSEDGEYISYPKKGSIIFFKSSNENPHGVNLIKSGIRVTLPIWFTDNEEFEERNDK